MEASAAMLQHNIHRVAVLDPESHTLIYLLTHSVILNFLIASNRAAGMAAVFVFVLWCGGVVALCCAAVVLC